VLSFSVSPCGGQSEIARSHPLFVRKNCGKGYLPFFHAENCRHMPCRRLKAYPTAACSEHNRHAEFDGSTGCLTEKRMWVTNAAFADVFTTFAKVDGKHFSCFLVRKVIPAFQRV